MRQIEIPARMEFEKRPGQALCKMDRTQSDIKLASTDSVDKPMPAGSSESDTKDPQVIDALKSALISRLNNTDVLTTISQGS